MKHSNEKASLQVKNEAEEYEKIISEQKKRIIALREEKKELEQKLSFIEAQKSLISEALVDARRTSDTTIRDARRAAAQIVSDATGRARREENAVNDCQRRLRELDACCEHILLSIRKQLDDGHVSLGVVVGGRK